MGSGEEFGTNCTDLQDLICGGKQDYRWVLEPGMLDEGKRKKTICVNISPQVGTKYLIISII